MKTKKAILDAHYINPVKNSQDTTNILLINNTLVGFGYIPDDDDCNQIKAKDHWIINYPTSFLEPSQTPPKNTPFDWISESGDHPIQIISDTGENILNHIQKHANNHTNVHLLIQDYLGFEILKKLHITHIQITASIKSSLLKTLSQQEKKFCMESKKIISFYCSPNKESAHFETIMDSFPLINPFELESKTSSSCRSLFKLKHPQLVLNTKKKFIVVHQTTGKILT